MRINMLDKLRKFVAQYRQGDEKKYQDYIKLQYNRSFSKYEQSLVDSIEIKRKSVFYDLIEKHVISDSATMQKALVLGCRNSCEIDILENKGIQTVYGVDLFSFDQRIKVLDFHDMSCFNDNYFDLVVSCHSLEHALNYEKVLDEIYRILRDGGILSVEVPVNYQVRGSDLHDFESSDNLLNIICKNRVVSSILLKEEVGKEKNVSGTDISRLIVKIKK